MSLAQITVCSYHCSHLRAILLRTDRDAAARLVNSSDPRDSPEGWMKAPHVCCAFDAHIDAIFDALLLPTLQAESYTSAPQISLCHGILHPQIVL